MHPELLRALAEARHEDLLSESRARGHAHVRVDGYAPLFSRSRQRVGALLISTGARLVGDQRAALEFAHE